MPKNVDARLTWIFDGEQALPIGAGRLKQSPIIPIERALQPLDQLDLSCRTLDGIVFLGLPTHRKIKKQDLRPGFSSLFGNYGAELPIAFFTDVSSSSRIHSMIDTGRLPFLIRSSWN